LAFLRFSKWIAELISVTASSAIRQLLHVLWIPRSLHGDAFGGAFDFTKIVWRQFHRNCSNVFF
jgi:hypothetical protein